MADANSTGPGGRPSTGKGGSRRSLNRHPEVVRLQREQTRELNEYLDRNRFYAYNDPEGFDAGMRMLGLDPGDTDQIVDVGGGAMRRDKVPELKQLLARQKRELRELKRRLGAETGTADP